MTRRKAPHEKQRPGPKPGAKAAARAKAQQVVEAAKAGAKRGPAKALAPVASAVAAVVAAAPAAAPAVAPRRDDPLQRHRQVDTMGEAELRDYGLQIGLTKRDAATLTVERLRTACKHRVYELIEDL